MCLFVCVCMHAHVCVCVWMHVHMFVPVCVRVYVCVCVANGFLNVCMITVCECDGCVCLIARVF